MKKIVFSFTAIVIAMAVYSCKDNPVTKKIKKTKQAVENTTGAYKEIIEMQEDIQELAQETPLTNEEIKEWLPAEVDGMNRSSYRAGSHAMMNIASVEATYTSEDKTREVKYEIIDGAGETGAIAVSGIRMILTQDMEEETDTRVKRTTKRKGTKVIEEYYKDGSRSTVEYLHGNRLYIKATGKGMSVEDLWDAIDEINPDKLI